MNKEQELRDKLAKIDALRRDAKNAEKMHSHWIGHDGELVELKSLLVRRRWRSDKTVHSEYMMGRAERELFRDWLYNRVGQITAEADRLAREIEETT